MVRNSAERLGGKYDLEPNNPLFSCTRSQDSPFKYLQCGIMLVLKGAVFLLDFLYYCTLSECLFPRTLCSRYTDKLSGDIQKKFELPYLAHSSVTRSECSFRESCPRELVHSSSYSKRALELGRVLSHRTSA